MKYLIKKHLGTLVFVMLAPFVIWAGASWIMDVAKNYGAFAAGFFIYPLFTCFFLPALGFIWLGCMIIFDASTQSKA